MDGLRIASDELDSGCQTRRDEREITASNWSFIPHTIPAVTQPGIHIQTNEEHVVGVTGKLEIACREIVVSLDHHLTSTRDVPPQGRPKGRVSIQLGSGYERPVKIVLQATGPLCGKCERSEF